MLTAVLSDGGVEVDLLIDDKFACKSKAIYSTLGADTSGHSHSVQAADVSMKVVAEMTTCSGRIKVKESDALTITVEYDMKTHPVSLLHDSHLRVFTQFVFQRKTISRRTRSH